MPRNVIDFETGSFLNGVSHEWTQRSIYLNGSRYRLPRITYLTYVSVLYSLHSVRYMVEGIIRVQKLYKFRSISNFFVCLYKKDDWTMSNKGLALFINNVSNFGNF